MTCNNGRQSVIQNDYDIMTATMASLGLVTPRAVTHGVTLFFLEKIYDLF